MFVANSWKDRLQLQHFTVGVSASSQAWIPWNNPHWCHSNIVWFPAPHSAFDSGWAIDRNESCHCLQSFQNRSLNYQNPFPRSSDKQKDTEKAKAAAVTLQSWSKKRMNRKHNTKTSTMTLLFPHPTIPIHTIHEFSYTLETSIKLNPIWIRIERWRVQWFERYDYQSDRTYDLERKKRQVDHIRMVSIDWNRQAASCRRI